MKRRSYSHSWPHLKLKIIGTYENFLGRGVIPKKYFLQYFPEDPVILEAGAHKGKDTLEMARLWPKGTIHAFEPVPHLYQTLIRKTKTFKNIHCYQVALGDTTGTQPMFISSGASDGSSSLLSPKGHLNYYPKVYFDEIIEVKTITLDDWAKENCITRIDFMWLDLQGLELNVLKSGRKILPTVRAIYSEVSGTELYEGQELYDQLNDWLCTEGFSIEREEIENGSGNVFFIRS